MRTYNSQTDYPILAAAVQSAGRAGRFLTATKEALEANGIEWPKNYNISRAPDALDIDRDIFRVLDTLPSQQPKQE